MEITILGSGTMVLSKKRHPSSYLVKIKNDYILLDCGHGLMTRLAKMNFDYLKINYLGLSHAHTDHLSDLMPFVHSQFVEFIFNRSRKRKAPLKIFVPKGFKKDFKALRKIMWPEIQEWPYVPIEIKECEKSRFKTKNFILETNPIRHTKIFKRALSFKIREGKKIFVYSGDTGPEMDKNSFINFIRQADLLIIDVSRPIGRKGGHLTPQEAGELAQQAKVKHLVLSHLKDINTEKELILDCQRVYQGKITIAYDLEKFKL